MRNNAYVRELADDPRLRAWLAAAGLTVEEAAAIQPTYECWTIYDCICGGNEAGDPPALFYPLPAKGVLGGIRVEGTTDRVRVDSIYGDSLGVVMGDEIDVAIAYPQSITYGPYVLVPIVEGGGPYRGIGLDSSRLVACEWGRRVTEHGFTTAVMSSDCRDGLASVAEGNIFGGPSKDCDEGCAGCDAGGDPSSLAILLALVAAIAPRRASRP